MLRKSLVMDCFKVLKKMESSLVVLSQPQLIASLEECVRSNMMIDRAQSEISNILKNLNDFPTSRLVNLPIHERALIALNKILNFVDAAQSFEDKVMLEYMINSVIPLENFPGIHNLLIQHLLAFQARSQVPTDAQSQDDVLVEQLSMQLFYLAKNVEDTFNKILE